MEHLSVELICKLVHENNRNYCRLIDDVVPPAWEDAADAQRVGIRKGAVNFVRHLASGQEPDPSLNHSSWLMSKLEAGWTYGPVKDEEKKQHPCMVPYDKLPELQKVKDWLFIFTLLATLRFANTEELAKLCEEIDSK